MVELEQLLQLTPVEGGLAVRQLEWIELYWDHFEPGAKLLSRDLLVQLARGLSEPISLDWSNATESLIEILPDPDSAEWDVGHALANDGLSAVAYAARCRNSEMHKKQRGLRDVLMS